MPSKTCPCTSGRAYADCCAPFHRGEREAPTPEALMRSRFAAYARGDVDYLWRTLHPDHEDRAAPKEPFLRTAKHACATYKYMRLRILEAREAEVLFRASVFEKGRDLSFLELSTFATDDGEWRYRSGIMRAADDRDWTLESFAAAAGTGPG